MNNFDNFDSHYEARLFHWLSDYVGMETFRPGLDRLEGSFSGIIGQLSAQKAKIITIGGTNGKGEVAQNLGYLLTKRGMKVGLWISPHVLSIRERFSFDGELIDYYTLEHTMESCRARLNGTQLSYYEYLFYVFLHLVVFKNVQVVILEVGMGGRFDAVNLLSPHLTAITSISRDHSEILGNSYRKILNEKLGIGRTDGLMVTSFELEYLRNITQAYCATRGILWKDLFSGGLLKKSDPYHIRNRIMAQILALLVLRPKRVIPERAKLFADASQSNWPIYKGRFEVVTIDSIRFIFIGAHNLDGIRKMIRALWYKNESEGLKIPFDVLLLSFSKRPLGEIKAMVRALAEGVAESIVLTVFDHQKAMGLGTEFEKKGTVEFVGDWKSYIKNIKNSHRDESGPKSILVSGSYYFIGHVQTYLKEHILS